MTDSPSRSEPGQTVESAMSEWAGALEGRRGPPLVIAEDWSRRRLAGVAIVIALLFPFYAHLVERELVRRELAEAAHAAEAALRDAQQAAAARARQASAAREAMDRRATIAAVRVVGVIDRNPPIVVVENLPPEGAAEVAEAICAQAANGLGRRVDGMVLRVTRAGGNRPGTDAGQVICPKLQ